MYKAEREKGPKVLSVVVPDYNEAKTIRNILARIYKVNLPVGINREVVVVDDFSTDGTRDILTREYGGKIKLLFHDLNFGKGRAVATGLKNVTGDYAVIQDADLEYDPEDWALMLEPIIAGRADVVYGSRLMSQRPHRVMYFWHYLGNKTLTFFSNIFTNLNLTDMETCYKMFTRDVVLNIKDKLVSDKFGIEPEITARIKKYRVFEVGISHAGRTYKEGKKINWKDGIAAFYHVIRFNLFSK